MVAHVLSVSEIEEMCNLDVCGEQGFHKWLENLWWIILLNTTVWSLLVFAYVSQLYPLLMYDNKFIIIHVKVCARWGFVSIFGILRAICICGIGVMLTFEVSGGHSLLY